MSDDIVVSAPKHWLRKPDLFFALVKQTALGPTLDASEVSGCNAITAAMQGAPIGHAAYALATAYLETGHTMQPVLEANWLSKPQRERYFFRMYDIGGDRPNVARQLGNLSPGDGVKFCGRGYVQATGRRNYKLASDKLGVDLIADPDKAMLPDIAAQVMRMGMDEGWFTGKSLRSFLPDDGRATWGQFVQARRIINGQDRAAVIADAAVKFQDALAAGEWA